MCAMRIERDIIKQFKTWKVASDRKPILLRGARQTGKTWAMETFGKECFKYCVKFDFDRQHELKSVFRASKAPERLIKELMLYCDQPIVAGETLMIFNEIQECESMQNLQYNSGLLSSPAPLAGWIDKWMTVINLV